MWGVPTRGEASSNGSPDVVPHSYRTASPQSSTSPGSVPMIIPLSRGRSSSRDTPSPVQAPQQGDRSPLSSRRSLPGSRKGSQNTLATLVESRDEGTELERSTGMPGYEEFVTHSMLLQSEIHSEQSSPLPWNVPEASSGGSQGRWPGGKKGNEKPPSTLDLSQQLAELQRRSVSVEKKRKALFHIGDSEKEEEEEGGRRGSIGGLSPTQALVPAHLVHLNLGSPSGIEGVEGRSVLRRVSSGSIEGLEGTLEEVFSLQLEEDPVINE